MKTKNQSFTINEEVLYKLGVFAKTQCISKSSAVNKILGRFLSIEVKSDLADSPYEKPPVIDNTVKFTEEERLVDWEWRKKMVNEGKFPTYMADEYPQTMRDYGTTPDIYLTPIKEAATSSREDKDFDESLKMSLEEKE
jgi:hypothetical protein